MTDRAALPPLPYPWPEIRAKLQDRLPALLDALGLRDELHHGRGDGQRIYPRNPMRDDRRAGSFVIWTAGDGAGAWKDYALNGVQGDVLDLVAYVGRLRSKIDTYWWALDFLGLDRKGRDEKPRTRSDLEAEQARREADRQAAEARQREGDEAKSGELFKLWLSLPGIEGTPAERYLRQVRGLPLERLGELPGALRWAERVEFDRVDPVTGEVTEAVWRHCMVSAMTRGKKLAALHRTYLKPDGSGKADIAKAKTMIGPVRGAAIRLSKGSSKMSPTEALKAGKYGPLAVGEGIETALSVAIARPDVRVWAAGSLSLMGLLEWPACASAVVLLGENDWKPEARRAFAAVEAHWRGQAKGRPVMTVHSSVGSDFNEMVRAG